MLDHLSKEKIYGKQTLTKRNCRIFNDDGKRTYTRDILVVKGLLDGEKIAIFMNHWPSRRGRGEAASQPRRNFAANAFKRRDGQK